MAPTDRSARASARKADDDPRPLFKLVRIADDAEFETRDAGTAQSLVTQGYRFADGSTQQDALQKIAEASGNDTATG
jgi:hypothetical protein